jgi:hypothetical protein
LSENLLTLRDTCLRFFQSDEPHGNGRVFVDSPAQEHSRCFLISLAPQF